MADEKPWLWKPGQTGNPKGRPPGILARDAARKYTELALETLIEACKHKGERVQAAIAILDRGWGKPKEQVEQVNFNVDMGGIDAPPLPETLDEWLARRRTELDKQLH